MAWGQESLFLPPPPWCVRPNTFGIIVALIKVLPCCLKKRVLGCWGGVRLCQT